MEINDAMKVRRCISALSNGGKTLEELAAAVGLGDGETMDRFEAFVLMLVVANLVGAEGQRYVLSEVFLDAAAFRLAQVYGGKRVYIKRLTPASPAEFLNELFGDGK